MATWFRPLSDQPGVKFKIAIDARQVETWLKNFSGSLSDMTSLMQLVGQEIAGEVSELFSTAAAGRMHPWKDWSEWTASWRANPPVAGGSASGGQRRGRAGRSMTPDSSELAGSGSGKALSYYAVTQKSGQDVIGVWSGEMKEWFMGAGSKGSIRVGPHSLFMGVPQDGAGDVKAGAFVRGRDGRDGELSWYGYGQARREGLPYSAFTLERIRAGGKPPSWRVYPQPERPIYENIDFQSQSESNPLFRAVRRWFDGLGPSGGGPSGPQGPLAPLAWQRPMGMEEAPEVKEADLGGRKLMPKIGPTMKGGGGMRTRGGPRPKSEPGYSG